jgi:hypothetical protein
MKAFLVILSAATIILLTACDEESPTSTSFSNGSRSIKLYNLNDNSVSNIKNVNGVVYDCIYSDSTFFIYGTYRNDLPELNVSNIFTSSYYGNRIYFYSAAIRGIQACSESRDIFLSSNDDIYVIKDYGNLVSNLTSNDIGFYDSPVFIPTRNIVTYGNSLIGEINGGMIFSRNLETGMVDVLVNESFSYIFPVFVTEDESHLIYTSNNLQQDGFHIKSVNLDDLQDIKILTNSIGVSRFGKNKTVDDKIVFTSDGTVYMLDLNTAELKAVVTGAQFADISKEGQKIVFSNEHNLVLINSDGTNPKILFSSFVEKKYLFLPSFSLNSEQIVFVESEYPFAYYEYEIN